MRFVNQNLQGIRDFFDSPIIINSGYRTAEYNKSIGGAMKSYHLYDVYGSDGRFAVDMRMELYHPREIYRTTRGLMRCGRIEQGGLTLYPTFVHYDNRGYYTSWKPDNLNV